MLDKEPYIVEEKVFKQVGDLHTFLNSGLMRKNYFWYEIVAVNVVYMGSDFEHDPIFHAFITMKLKDVK